MKKRGPNSFKTLELELENNLRLDFAASVLGLRGSDYLTEQPLTDPHSGNVLLWNGELFHSDRIRVKPDENDSLCVFNELCKNSGQKSEKEIFEAFEAIKGSLIKLVTTKKFYLQIVQMLNIFQKVPMHLYSIGRKQIPCTLVVTAWVEEAS